MTDEELQFRPNLEKQIVEIEAFMKTNAFRALKKTFAVDIARVEESILVSRPVDITSTLQLAELHGKCDQAKSQLTLFEDALATLKEQVAKMVDLETQARENQNQ